MRPYLCEPKTAVRTLAALFALFGSKLLWRIEALLATVDLARAVTVTTTLSVKVAAFGRLGIVQVTVPVVPTTGAAALVPGGACTLFASTHSDGRVRLMTMP